MAVPRVSLSKKQLQTPAGAELHAICQSIKADGQLSKEEIVRLAKWLRAHDDCDLPAATYLSSVVERIVSDRVVSATEMAELHEAIERVLPIETRRLATGSRKAIEKVVQEKKKELDDAVWEAAKQDTKDRRDEDRERRRLERANRRPGFHSKVAGTTRQNEDGTDRQQIIRDNLKPGMEFIHKREPNNPYDEWAISLWVKTKSLGVFEADRQIGYLNTSIACDLGPYLDRGGWLRITVSEITGGNDRNHGVNILVEDRREVL
jgi:hypothetical protein